MSSSQDETSTDSVSSNNVQNHRSYVLELIGVVSVVGFFVGIYFAYQTQIAGVITRSEFDRIQPGQSVAAVSELLGFEGRLVSPEPGETADSIPTAMPSTKMTYVWENSSISYVQCEFVNDCLTSKSAVDLP